MPVPSEVQAALPPPIGYCTRGITSASSLPVSTSKICKVPCSLPPSDKERAIKCPSREGTNQSIAVVPLVLKALGSKTDLHNAGGSSDESRTSTGCCAGGLNRIAKVRPRFQLKPK